MVSLVLLTTEELLESNRFWCRLDSLWITEDLEPFDEVNPEDIYVKPLTRDSYYAKYPDIARSESEDENPITITGFQHKYCEWRSKVFLKKICENRRSSLQFLRQKARSNETSNAESTRRHSSVFEKATNAPVFNNDERVSDFFNRLLKSVPPPPLEELNREPSNSIIEPPKDNNFNNITIPEDYTAFEEDTIIQGSNSKGQPASSTLKRSRKKSGNSRKSFCEFEHKESWYETIYGLSDLLLDSDHSSSCEFTSDVTIVEVKMDDLNNNSDSYKNCNISNEYEFESWSDVIMPLGQLDDEISAGKEEFVSQSHDEVSKITEISETDDETGYARFAVYKIYQTLKIERGMIDSSSMKDFHIDDETEGVGDQCKSVDDNNASYIETVYRLVPSNDDYYYEN